MTSPKRAPWLEISQQDLGALRTLLRTETARVEQWVRMHGKCATTSALQNSKGYLAQLRSLQHAVETSIGKGRY
ncbi:hypothetical protein [Acidisoma sp. 7E03]